MKLLMKALPGMFEHSDKNVRAEVCVLAHSQVVVYLEMSWQLLQGPNCMHM